MDRHNNIFYRAPRGTWRKGITNRAYRNVCLITAIRHFCRDPVNAVFSMVSGSCDGGGL